jgi:hypothetical protein
MCYWMAFHNWICQTFFGGEWNAFLEWLHGLLGV